MEVAGIQRSLPQKFEEDLKINDLEDSEDEEEDSENEAEALREKARRIVKNFLQQVKEEKVAVFDWPPEADCPVYKYHYIENCMVDLDPQEEKSASAKKYLTQVRESWGYDVDCVPPPWMDCNLAKLNLGRLGGYSELVEEAMECLMDRINTEAVAIGKTFELLKLNKVVRAGLALYLMTLTLKDDVTGAELTVRATVSNPPPCKHPELEECKLTQIVPLMSE